MRLASVIGPEFDLDVLLAASGQPESDVLDHLDAALQVRSHQLREAQQNALALLGLRAPPDTALEGGARRGHGRLHVSGLTTRDLGNDATIYRADVLERATRVGCHQLAVDESAAFGPQPARDLHPFRAASGRNTRVHGVSAP